MSSLGCMVEECQSSDKPVRSSRQYHVWRMCTLLIVLVALAYYGLCAVSKGIMTLYERIAISQGLVDARSAIKGLCFS